MTELEQAYANKKVLVTGGLGFIGSNLVERLVQLNAEVTIVDSLVPEYGGNLFNVQRFQDRVRVNVSDVRDEYSMKYLVQGKDYLFNLAGQTSHLDSMEDPQTDLEINCRSQLSILEACRRCAPAIQVVFASTRQIYGRPAFLPVNESHLLRPVDVNGINKMAGERYHIVYNDVYDIRSCSLRLTNTYGPHMRVKDARQTFLGVWVRRLVEGQPFEVWEGDQLRDFTYVDDAVTAFLLAGFSQQANGRVYNLGGECVISLKSLADLMVELNGGGEYVVRTYPRNRKRIDIGDYYADFARITSELGWQPTVPLRDGLARTLAYYREHLPCYL